MIKPEHLQDLLAYDTIWGVLTYAERIEIRYYLLGRSELISEKIQLMAEALIKAKWVNPCVRWKNTAEQICTHWQYDGWSLERYRNHIGKIEIE